MPVAELELANIYYESVGQGPPLVFAHGAGGNALSWWQQTAFFGAGYRCITFDHPGFRHSSWGKPETDPGATFGNVLLQLLDHLEIDRVGLIAQSMGGWTCLRFAVDHPQRVAALVMAATDGGLYLPNREAYSEQDAVLEKIRAAWQEREPGSFHPAAGARMLAEQPELHEMYVEIGEQNGVVSRRGWGQVSSSELVKLRCPTLLITGEEDIACSPRRLELLHAAVAGSELVAVPESGHSVYFERADLFNSTVDEFLGRNYPAALDGRTIVQSFANPD